MEITNEERARYFAMYWGASFISNLGNAKVGWQCMRYINHTHQLILSPLSDKSITPDQRKELTKIYYGDTGEFDEDTDMFLIENISFNLFDSVQNAAKIINYLRSISIDCDDLITRGIAIKK